MSEEQIKRFVESIPVQDRHYFVYNIFCSDNDQNLKNKLIFHLIKDLSVGQRLNCIRYLDDDNYIVQICNSVSIKQRIQYIDRMTVEDGKIKIIKTLPEEQRIKYIDEFKNESYESYKFEIIKTLPENQWIKYIDEFKGESYKFEIIKTLPENQWIKYIDEFKFERYIFAIIMASPEEQRFRYINRLDLSERDRVIDSLSIEQIIKCLDEYEYISSSNIISLVKKIVSLPEEQRIQYIDRMTDELNKLEVIESLPVEQRIECIEKLLYDSYKVAIIKNLTEENKRIECIEKIFDDRFKIEIIKTLSEKNKEKWIKKLINKKYVDEIINSLSVNKKIKWKIKLIVDYIKFLIIKTLPVKQRIESIEKITEKYLKVEIIKTLPAEALQMCGYILFEKELASMERTKLTSKECELIHKFAVNNSDLFSTLRLKMLDPKIISIIGESSLEKIVRYSEVESTVLHVANDEFALKTFGFALENLRMDNFFIESLIEKLGNSILSISKSSVFFNLVSQRIDRKDLTLTDYEKVIISFLALNPKKSSKITSYDDILSFVERKNQELEGIVNNTNSTLSEVKNAYLERVIGLDYDTVSKLVRMYGNDPEQLLQNYKNVSLGSFKELGEKEALEIIIKLKSVIEMQDINAIRNEFFKYVSMEKKEDLFIRYQEAICLESSLRRAYGRDLVDSLSKNMSSFQIQELKFKGEKYFVRKVNGEFNRMVSLLEAYGKSFATKGDMYDRWNTNKMADNHALCYSLINQSNPGTAMVHGKKGIIISINGFSPESLSTSGPYDLSSTTDENTISTMREQRFFSVKEMPNQTRHRYSEYNIEIQDALSESDKYQKIQPASIICFEEVDEDSIRAAIDLGKKLGHPVPIELIDRRELAKQEMLHITEALNKFKTSETIDPTLVGEIITRFGNVRSAHRYSNLSDELLGENNNINIDAPFNYRHLNQILTECLASVEQRIRSGQVQEGLEALKSIEKAISDEESKNYGNDFNTGIDKNINQIIDDLQKKYKDLMVEPLKEQRRELRRKQFEARVAELGIQIDSTLTLDKLFQQYELMQQNLREEEVEQDKHHR